MVNKEPKMPKKINILDSNFESTLVPEDNGKQNLNESYTNKYQKYIACSRSYKFMHVLMINLVSLLSQI